MSEGKHKLNRQREKSEPRPVFDVRSKPLHANRRPASQEAKASRPPRCYNITSQGSAKGVNRGLSACWQNLAGVCDSRNAKRRELRSTPLAQPCGREPAREQQAARQAGEKWQQPDAA